jgi:hypothetical protein
MTTDPAEPAAAPGLARRVLVPVVKVGVSAALLVVLFSRIDTARFWQYARTASIGWLGCALGLYLAMLLVSTWRWALLLRAQHARVAGGTLVSSYLVATFFNNFLPSNIGGDVVRIADTAPAAGSKTLATTVVLIDRAIGLIGLVLVAAMGATVAAALLGSSTVPVWPSVLWAGFAFASVVSVPALLAPTSVGRALRPLRVFHEEWVTERIGRITGALARFREQPVALVGCFAGAVAVQVILVLFYVAIARSMGIPVSPWHLAVIVPVTFVVQMLPVSVNGFGVREATFSYYFHRLGLPLESALVVSFAGAALIMAFSLSGGVAYIARVSARRHVSEPEVNGIA